MNKKRIDEILAEAGLDFEKTDKTLYVNYLQGFVRVYEDSDYFPVEIMKGLNKYCYYNFYEVMLWYRFYTCARRIITKNPTEYYSNASYFSRIPSHYRSTSPERGLSVVKEALGLYIDHYNGIPKYFTVEDFDEMCYIK
jgi:hypothetical protein